MPNNPAVPTEPDDDNPKWTEADFARARPPNAAEIAAGIVRPTEPPDQPSDVGDIVERLGKAQDWLEVNGPDHAPACQEAAAHICQLRADNAALQAKVDEAVEAGARLKAADEYLGRALSVVMPLIFRHKKDFGELQIIIDACGKARAEISTLSNLKAGGE